MEVYEILKGLAFPRKMGSEGEVKAVGYIKDKLKKIGIESITEKITYNNASTYLMNIFFLLAIFIVVFLNIMNTIRINLWVPWVSILFIFGMTFLISYLMVHFLGSFNIPDIGEIYSGYNIIGEILPKNVEKGEVILTAHYDSVSNSIPMNIYKKLMMIAGPGGLLILLISLISNIINLFLIYDHPLIYWLDTIFLVISIPEILIILFSMTRSKGNDSSGACDDGTGCAILIKLTEIFSDYKLENTKLTFLFTGAEEQGLFGSRAYVTKYKERLTKNKDKIYQFNVDCIYGPEIGYLSKTGFIKKKPMNKTLNELLAHTAKVQKIEVKEINAMSIGSSSDHAPFIKAIDGWEACGICPSLSHDFIHSKKDALDKINPKKLEDAVELIKSTIMTLDLKYIGELNEEK